MLLYYLFYFIYFAVKLNDHLWTVFLLSGNGESSHVDSTGGRWKIWAKQKLEDQNNLISKKCGQVTLSSPTPKADVESAYLEGVETRSVLKHEWQVKNLKERGKEKQINSRRITLGMCRNA